MSKKHKARMTAKREVVRPGTGNMESAFQKCIGRTIVDVKVGQTGTFITRTLVFDDDSQLVLHSNGTFGWQGQPYVALPPAPQETK